MVGPRDKRLRELGTAQDWLLKQPRACPVGSSAHGLFLGSALTKTKLRPYLLGAFLSDRNPSSLFKSRRHWRMLCLFLGASDQRKEPLSHNRLAGDRSLAVRKRQLDEWGS